MITMKNIFISILIFSFCLAVDSERPSYEILKLDGNVAIDGILDETIWNTGPPITGFIQKDPQPGAPSRNRSEIRLAMDDEFIYVGAYLYDSSPDSIARQIIRRDGWGYSDEFAIGIDSYFDRRTCFGFGVNPSGSLRDMLHYNDTETDDSWDAVWEAKSIILDDGWSTEMKIPLSQLRYNPSENDQVWGLNFYRKTARYGEESFWAPILMETKGFVSHFGNLTGLKLPKQKKRLEILPYFAGKNYQEDGSEYDPYWEKNDLSGNLGVDLKVGIGSNFTLTGTINPDFGQVEADPANLNLSAFETFFEERRPFFLEGTDIFQFGRTRSFSSGNSNLFYSRRIGREPRGYVTDGGSQFEDYPSQTNILTALKLSGKTKSGLSIGILDAVTREEKASYIDSLGQKWSHSIEPLANSLVLRLKQDMRGGKVVLGSFMTHRKQDLSTAYLDSSFLKDAFVIGADLEYALPDPSWILSGYTARSIIEGHQNIITEIQRNSSHYFQRPSDDISVDSTLTSLSGVGSEISLTKISGKNLKGSLTFGQSSPGYDVNELGYMRSANLKKLNSSIEYEDFVPKKYWQIISLSFGTWQDWDYSWDNGSSGINSDLWIRFHNWYSMSLDYGRSFGGINRNLTRGGPVASVPIYDRLNISIRTDRRKKMNGYLRIGNRSAEDGEYDRSFRTGINFRPDPQWKVELDLFMNDEFDTDQYITTISDPLASKTFGARYVFSDISSSSRGLTFEASMIQSPQLSFQFFLQPELGYYDYEGLKEFLYPGKYDFMYYDDDQITEFDSETLEIDSDGSDGAAIPFLLSKDYIRGFNFISLRSNFILKWEFRPGSSLFLVWQQQRDHYEVTDVELKLDAGMDKLLGAESVNTFMVKMAYWFSS